MCLRFSGDNWPGSINFKSDQVHQNPWKSIKHGSTGSLKMVPKRASIECRARPPVPPVMKVCFILVLGHKYGTCALVFYRGVLLRTSCPKCTDAPLFYRENGVKNTSAPQFYRGCFEGVTCTPRFISIKWGGTSADLNWQGDIFTLKCGQSETFKTKIRIALLGAFCKCLWAKSGATKSSS